MMKSKKRGIVWILIGMMFIGLLVGCSEDNSTQPNPIVPAENHLLNAPTNVVYETTQAAYFVANGDDGSIVTISNDGKQRYFNQELPECNGLSLSKSVLYVTSRQEIRGINLATGNSAVYITIPESSKLGPIIYDGHQYAYVLDRIEQQIYRVDMTYGAYSLFVTKGLADAYDLCFDPFYNRLVITGGDTDSCIQTVDLQTGIISTMKIPAIGKLGAIARDDRGQFYVLTRDDTQLYCFSATFEDSPTCVASCCDGASALCVNCRETLIAIVNKKMHSIELIAI